jgi:hypothetical protein
MLNFVCETMLETEYQEMAQQRSGVQWDEKQGWGS